jgi:transcriptional regulator with XRE-family HTH domain
MNDPRRAALKTFLRAMRTRLSPEAAGFAGERQRRRVPGLRIEEAAALAGVSLTWYSALEGGKDIRVSDALLEKVASALQLDAVEREYLRSLAVPTERVSRHEDDDLLQSVVDGFATGPAQVIDALWNVKLFNHAADVVYGLSQSTDPNILRRMFLDNSRKSLHPDWEDIAQQMVAILRLSFGRAPRDPAFLLFVAELENQSPDFARWWKDQSVQRFEPKTATLTHATLGLLEFHFASFVVAAATDVDLPTYILLHPAANFATAAQMHALYRSSTSDSTDGPAVKRRPYVREFWSSRRQREPSSDISTTSPT